MEIKIIEIGENLLAENDKIAEENFKILKEKNILSFNLMGAPGSGKTRLLERTIPSLQEKYRCGVIEGDIAETFDSERLKRFNIPIVQINTQGACHLEALMIKKGLENLPLEEIDILFVENVGNLVCPAEFKLGIEKNIVVSSITEGENKPIKYPLMFKISHLCILNKIDLIEYLNFNVEKFERDVKKTNPEIEIIRLSAEKGENIEEWINYIENLKG